MKLKWMKLIGSLMLLILFIYTLPFLHQMLPGSKSVIRVIKSNDIDTTALFYSEEKKTIDAEIMIRESLVDSSKD